MKGEAVSLHPTRHDGFFYFPTLEQEVLRMAKSQKYTALRKRFFDNFYFQGRVAVSIDKGVPGGKVTFGDQTLYMGLALMMLSTELAVLQDPSATDAESRIREILNAFEELDRKAEKYIDPQATDELNGFFVRDDITGPNDPRLGNRFAQVDSDFQNPQLENASPSGDQIFGLMYGLLSVVRYSGESGLSQRASENSARLYDYARRCFFDLQLPNGNETRRGSDMRWLASLCHGLNKAITGMDLFNQSKIKIDGFPVALNGIGAFWAADQTPSTFAELAGQKIDIPLLGKKELNAFALHIILMALAPGEVWKQSAIESVGLKCNHHLSILWNCQVHSTKPNGFGKADIQQFLDACPDDGPRASLAGNTGWAHDNRWIRCSDCFEPNGGTEEYNGLDWLLLENFSELVFG